MSLYKSCDIGLYGDDNQWSIKQYWNGDGGNRKKYYHYVKGMSLNTGYSEE